MTDFGNFMFTVRSSSSSTLTSSLSKNFKSDPAEGRGEVVVKSRREREEVGVNKLERQACGWKMSVLDK